MAYVSIKSAFVAATILAASLGFANLAQAAPIAGTASTVVELQKAQMLAGTDGLIQKAYHKGKTHKKYYSKKKRNYYKKRRYY